MADVETFVDAFARSVAEVPDRAALIHCHGTGAASERVLSYAELDHAARAVAAWLQRRCHPGDRALLLYPAGSGFACAFLGCLYAGVTPVPAPLPSTYRHQLDRTKGIASDAEVAVVLTDRENLEPVSGWLRQDGLAGLPYAATDGLGEGDGAVAGDWVRPPAGRDTLAFLQYTSGSTSEPKGVMVANQNLLANIEVGKDLLGWTRETTFCSWLPTYHDMGLIAMMLMPLVLGSTTVVLSPTDFLKHPYRWLELIDRHGVHASCAPNFAYDLCVRRLTDEQVAGLDLSRWRHACNGAEPVDANTLARFTERFAPAGFRPEAFIPGYGMAETTLFVAGTRPAAPPTVRTVDPDRLARHEFAEGPGVPLVSNGVPGDFDVRIVDPETRRVLPPGRVGEVWLRGPSVALGYWRKDEETRRTFRATTAGGEGGFLRTGDLGTFHDGELYVTGRLKEMMIVNGRNLYPHDLERAVHSLVPRLAGNLTCVFSVPAPREEIVVLQELRTRTLDGVELAALAGELKATLGEHVGTRVGNVAFVRPGTIRRTTSGKIQRTAMRELFLTDAVDAVHEELDPGVRERYRRADAELATARGRSE